MKTHFIVCIPHYKKRNIKTNICVVSWPFHNLALFKTALPLENANNLSFPHITWF